MQIKKRTVIWGLFILFSVLGGVYAWTHFTGAFPVVDMAVETDRHQAEEIARRTAETKGFDLTGTRTAVRFELDREVQYYTELEAGGKPAFREMLQDTLYEPYTWLVRFFRERQEEEFLVRLTPDGKIAGFYEKVPEDAPGPELTEPEARRLTQETAAAFQVPLHRYQDVEVSSERQPGGRLDYTLVYELPEKTLGEARYRIRFTVSGDRVTGMKRFMDIPEGFYLRYENMRAANRTIANAGLVLMFIFLGLGGLGGLYYLMKHHAVQWKPAVIWGCVIAGLQVGTLFNQWPLIWMNYDTAVSKSNFILIQLFGFFLSGIVLALEMILTFAVAEGLTRRAFPGQIRFWHVWNKRAGASPEIWQQTLIGYLSVGLFFAFTTVFYLFMSRRFDWWSPASPLYDPNILANIFPWLNPIAISLQAGFWEEALFRAIPLAGAALLGERFGGKKWWVGSALILQALIFGAGHAAYANQPAYARVVELFLPALGFGLIYLRWGLLPAIILHYLYDVVWISLPLFNSTSPGSGFSRVMVIFFALLPLGIIFFRRLISGKQVPLEEDYNGSHVPVPPAPKREPEFPLKTNQISPVSRVMILILGVVFLYVWYTGNSFRKEDPGLGVGRAEARRASKAALADQGFILPDSVWMVSERMMTPNGLEDRFVRQSGGETIYRQMMGHFLSPPHWTVRYARFGGDVAERAEEFRIRVVRDGRVTRFTHRLPEARPGATLSETEARKIAGAFIRSQFGLDPSRLKEISAVPSKKPNRTDWTFTWADTICYPLTQGQGRLKVILSGDEVTDYNPGYVYIPEKWERDEKNRETIRNLIQNLSVVLLFFLIILTVIKGYHEISHENISYKLWIIIGVFLFLAGLFHFWNRWPETLFDLNPAEPVQGQVFRAVAFSVIQYLIVAFSFPLLFLATRNREADHMRDRPGIWTGLGAGFAGLGVVTFIQNQQTHIRPVWADYGSLNSRIPLMDTLLMRVWLFAVAVVILLSLFRGVDRFTGGAVRNSVQEWVIFILTGFGISAILWMDTLTVWLTLGGFAFLWLLWLYRVVFRAMPSVIPFAILPFFLAESYTQIRYQGYPGVITAEIAAMTGCLVAAVIISRYLSVKPEKP